VRATLFNKYKDPDAMGGSSTGKRDAAGQLVQIVMSPKA
jgi:hypothetical protein